LAERGDALQRVRALPRRVAGGLPRRRRARVA
jgi:hypothetical protein